MVVRSEAGREYWPESSGADGAEVGPVRGRGGRGAIVSAALVYAVDSGRDTFR